MKNIIKLTLALFTFALFITSCDTTESPEMSRNAKPAVKVDTPTIQLSEGGTAAITISTNTPINKPLIFKLVQVGGNAVDGEDYTFDTDLDNLPDYYSAADYGAIGGKIVIPAYANTGSLTIHGMTDFVLDNKKATFELRAMESMNGVTTSKNSVSVTVTDYTDDFVISLSWTTDDASKAKCDQDLDVFLVDSANAGVDTAASAACLETVVLPGSSPDGDYFIDVDYWVPSDVTVTAGDPEEYNTAFFLEYGNIGQPTTTTFNGTSSTSRFLNWSAYGQFGGNGYHSHVIKITKTGGTYVVQ